jgi:hypothetical protein
MSFDAESRREETFRREGDTEILEFERRDDGELNDEDDIEVTSLNEEDDDHHQHRSSTASTASSSTTSTSLTPRRQKRKSGLDVLPEEDDDEVSGSEANVPERKMSENKMLQTDITYGKANKRIQVFKRKI